MNTIEDSKSDTASHHETETSIMEGTALACGILGVLGFFFFGLLLAIPAVISGHVAQYKLSKDKTKRGKRLNRLGLILGYLAIAGSVVILILMQMEELGIPWDSFTYHIKRH